MVNIVASDCKNLAREHWGKKFDRIKCECRGGSARATLWGAGQKRIDFLERCLAPANQARSVGNIQQPVRRLTSSGFHCARELSDVTQSVSKTDSQAALAW